MAPQQKNGQQQCLVHWKPGKGLKDKQLGQVTALKAGGIIDAWGVAVQCVHRVAALSNATEDAIPFGTLKDCFTQARADLCY